MLALGAIRRPKKNLFRASTTTILCRVCWKMRVLWEKIFLPRRMKAKKYFSSSTRQRSIPCVSLLSCCRLRRTPKIAFFLCQIRHPWCLVSPPTYHDAPHSMSFISTFFSFFFVSLQPTLKKNPPHDVRNHLKARKKMEIKICLQAWLLSRLHFEHLVTLTVRILLKAVFTCLLKTSRSYRCHHLLTGYRFQLSPASHSRKIMLSDWWRLS